MIEQLGALLGGGVLGVVGNLFAEGLKFFREREQHKREIEMRKLDMVMMVKEAELAERQMAMQLERDEIVADTEALKASYVEAASRFSEGDGGQWGVLLVVVDVVRGLTRPALTVGLIMLTAAVYFHTTSAEVESMLANSIVAAAGGALSWWFSSRHINKHQQQRG